MMGLFEHWPYVNFHDLNLDWVIKEIPKVFASRDEAQASAEASAESAAASQLSAEAAQASAADAQLRAEAAQGSAETAEQNAEETTGTAQELRSEFSLLDSRIDNIIMNGQQTEGNTELIDIRVSYNGVKYDTAGDSVRKQALDLHKDFNNAYTYYTQFLDFTKAKNGYYPTDGNFTEASGYKAIETFLPAGTYFIYGNFSRGWSWIGGQTLTSLSPVNVNINEYNCAEFTILSDSVAYFTCSGTDEDQLVFNSPTMVPIGIIGNYDYNYVIPVGLDKVENIYENKQYIKAGTGKPSSFWTSMGARANVSDDKWISFDMFTLEPGTYYAYNVGSMYQKVNGEISTINKTALNTTPYAYTFTISETADIMVNARYAASGVTVNNVTVGDDISIPENNAYNGYSIKFKPFMLAGNIMVVDKSGHGDFTEVQNAIDNIINDSPDNPYTIIVLPGTYGKIDMKRHDDGSHALRYISMIGTDRDRCIIADDKCNYAEPAANIRTNGTIKNLSFMNYSSDYTPTQTQEHAYAVHEDFGLCDVTYENCLFYSEAGPGIGIGMVENKKIRLINCESICNEIVGDKPGLIGAIYAHGSPTATLSQTVEIRNSVAVNKVNEIGIFISCNQAQSEMKTILIGNISTGTNGANAFLEGNLDLDYSGLNNFNV